jgi:hypothetical protein
MKEWSKRNREAIDRVYGCARAREDGLEDPRARAHRDRWMDAPAPVRMTYAGRWIEIPARVSINKHTDPMDGLARCVTD